MPKPALLTSRSTGRVGVGEPVGHPLHLRPVGQVRREDLGADLVRRAELVGHVLQPGPVAGHEHEVVPPLGQLAAEGEADAGRGAGDQCGTHAAAA